MACSIAQVYLLTWDVVFLDPNKQDTSAATPSSLSLVPYILPGSAPWGNTHCRMFAT